MCAVRATKFEGHADRNPEPRPGPNYDLKKPKYGHTVRGKIYTGADGHVVKLLQKAAAGPNPNTELKSRILKEETIDFDLRRLIV